IGLMPEGFQRRQIGSVGSTRAEPSPPPAVRQRELVCLIVTIRPGEAEGRERTHHQAGVDLPKCAVTNPQFGHQRRGIIVNEQVRPSDQMPELLLTLLLPQVKRHSAFVGVEGEKKTALLRVWGAGGGEGGPAPPGGPAACT